MNSLRAFLMVVCFGIVSTVSGHNPNQIGYDLNENDQSLTIHFTLRSAVDLLKSICPDALQGPTVYFPDYYQDIAAYFNDALELHINDSSVYFEWEEAAMDQHDAHITFGMSPLGPWESIQMTVNSYTEIYRKTQNVVRVQKGHTLKKFYLDKDKRSLLMDF